MLRLVSTSRLASVARLALALVALAPAGALAAPRLVVSSPVHNFGNVHDDAPIIHTFLLENTGDAPLAITRIRPGCPDCTRYALERDVIPAGESATLEVALNPTGLEDDVEKDLVLESNDPATPQLTLWMQGFIEPRFYCLPEKIIIELASTNAEGLARAFITPRRTLNQPLTMVESDSPFIEGVVMPEVDGSFVLQVSTRPPLPTGILHGRLRLFSADTNDPSCHVPVDVGVWPGFLAVPDVLNLTTTPAEQLRILFLRQFPDTPHRVTGVESTASNLTFEIYGEPGGLNYRITVFSRGEVDAGRSEIRILTDDPEQPVLQIPVWFAPQQPEHP